jgi:anaphase-promoting complex subunit 4
MGYRPVTESVHKKLLPHGKAGRMEHSLKISQEQMEQFIVHTFPPEERFKPLRIEVNGRKNRRFVAVIAEDLRYLRIFDLDFKAEDEIPSRLRVNELSDVMVE